MSIMGVSAKHRISAFFSTHLVNEGSSISTVTLLGVVHSTIGQYSTNQRTATTGEANSQLKTQTTSLHPRGISITAA